MIKRNLFILIIIFSTLITKAQKWTSFTNLNISISGYQVNSEAVDVNGAYWFGTNNGVSKFDSKIWTNYSTINGLVSDSVNIITIDENNIIWAGTQNGLSFYNGAWNNGSWNTYSKMGLINNTINSIAIDGQNNMWFATNGGISVYGNLTVDISSPIIGIKPRYISIYPNPSINETMILLPEPGLYNLKIMDITGKEVKEINNVKDKGSVIQTKDMPQGIYILTSKNNINGNTYIGKIIVSK